MNAVVKKIEFADLKKLNKTRARHLSFRTVWLQSDTSHRNGLRLAIVIGVARACGVDPRGARGADVVDH